MSFFYGKPPVKRTERGWAGHYIMAYRCFFRRNTLLERGEERIVVSTIGGQCVDYKGERVVGGMETVGHDRHFETVVFPAIFSMGVWECDPDANEIAFSSPRHLRARLPAGDPQNSVDANDMHEAVVAELIATAEWNTQ